MIAVMIATAVMIQAETRHDASLCCLGFKLRRLSAINHLLNSSMLLWKAGECLLREARTATKPRSAEFLLIDLNSFAVNNDKMRTPEDSERTVLRSRGAAAHNRGLEECSLHDVSLRHS